MRKFAETFKTIMIMEGFRNYEINYDAIDSEIYRTDLRMWEAHRKYNDEKEQYYRNRLERLKIVKEWYKKRMIKFIEQL